MKVTAIKTRKFLPPKDDLFSLLKESFSKIKLKEKSIIVVTSKIVSIWQGRCLSIEKGVTKDMLIKQEADMYIDRDAIPGKFVILTMKDGILIPSAGIDESNANGYYILWPDKPFLAAKEIYEFLKKEYKLEKCGVIISDSHTTPLRNGMTGFGISYWGFNPLRDYRGKQDIFGRTLKMTQTHIVDSLTAAAVLLMGEGSEQMPLAVVSDINGIEFTDTDFTKSNLLIIDKDIDIYAPLVKSALWKKGNKKIVK